MASSLILFAPSPAAAHPFGDPQTVTVSADPQRDGVVHVRWKVGGTDDLTLLGVHLGVLPQDRVMLDGAVFFEPSDAVALGPSEQFARYLREQITVTSDGDACAGTVTPPSDLVAAGVTVDYACPGPIGTVAVGVRMLIDLNPAYQTLASGPNGERAVYGSGRYAHDWVLGDAPARSGTDIGRSAAVQIAAVVGGLVFVALAVLVLRRWRRRSAAV
ncbi:hypothetical protein M8C17_02535 [Micromonospora sp. RHAY321]|uniref:hypothetical protein n=1 Tax=Micromonospora sp. RHAY321 TaxID=2944807 RepID=UPI00207D6B12|nr:hypothetical protein [Micromonospora sp. RHAY321]MCO1594030.1 hypothetical protein [Micromonospora sp. RHAY321]